MGADAGPSDFWRWMLRGFVSVVVVVVALAALAVWLWLRPLREGYVQAVLLWLGCALFVGVMALVWWPSHDGEGDPSQGHHRHAWVVLVGLLAVSALMAELGIAVAREDRRPPLRELIATVVAGEPVTFAHEDTWAYQPRFVGGLGNSDWSVCRSYSVTGDAPTVADRVAAALTAAGVDVGAGAHIAGDATPRYAEVRVEGPEEETLIVCVDEVDPDNR